MIERTLMRVTLLVAAGTVPLPAPRSLAAQDPTDGKKVYVKWCAGCHGDESTRGAAQVLECAGWRVQRRGPQGGPSVLRFHRLPEMPRRPGSGRRPLRADAEGRRGLPDLRGRPA